MSAHIVHLEARHNGLEQAAGTGKITTDAEVCVQWKEARDSSILKPSQLLSPEEEREENGGFSSASDEDHVAVPLLDEALQAISEIQLKICKFDKIVHAPVPKLDHAEVHENIDDDDPFGDAENSRLL